MNTSLPPRAALRIEWQPSSLPHVQVLRQIEESLHMYYEFGTRTYTYAAVCMYLR